MHPILSRLTAALVLAFAPAFGHAAVESAMPAPAISVPALKLEPQIAIGAATPEATAAEPAAAWRGWHGVLFRVVPPTPVGVSAPDAPPLPASYLFGSIHYGTLDEIDIVPADVKSVIAETQTLVSEADADEKFDASYDRYRFLPVLEPLTQLIGGDAFNALLALLPMQPKDSLRRFKPWLVLALLESRGEVAGPDNLDGRIAEWSRDASLKTAALESLREQMAALDCVPAREHAQVLAQRIAAPWVLQEQSAEVLGFYRNRDLVAWMDEVDSMSGLDEHARGIETRAKHCLIDDRNTRWIDRLDPMLRAGSCFVAVGAIHLMGERGLLNLLALRGYTIVAQTI